MNLNQRQIEAAIGRLDDQIQTLGTKRGELFQQLLELKSKFKVGDKIQWRFGQGLKYGTVESITHWCCDEPCWKVRVTRKDGTPGNLVEVRDYQNPIKS